MSISFEVNFYLSMYTQTHKCASQRKKTNQTLSGSTGYRMVETR